MAVDNLIGQKLGQYEIRALLGRGGMGAVYRAFQANLKRDVAIKVMDTRLIHDKDYLQRFSREAQISASLDHDNIIKIYDFGVQGDLSYIVMQYLTGGSLAQRLHKRQEEDAPAMSPGEIGTLLRQIAAALDYAHSQGVIHRDIKTANIMFDKQGKPYLVDFGIARLQDATSATSSAIGTPSHMAPEQWRNDPLTPAADQYAVGVMVYELLTQRAPFIADTPYAMMHAHLFNQPAPIRTLRVDLPSAVDDVLRRVLAKAPEERFANVSAFSQAYDQAIRGNEGETTGFYRYRYQAEASAAKPSTSGSRPAVSISTDEPTFKTDGSGDKPPLPPTSTPPNPAPRRNGLFIGLALLIALLVVGAVFFLNRPTGNSELEQELTRVVLAITQDALTARAALTQTAIKTAQLTTTPTPSATLTLAETATPTASATASETATMTASATLTNTATPTATNTATATATNTPTATATATATDKPTDTPTLTATLTATASATLTETATVTPSVTPSTTYTATATASATDTATSTATATPTETATPSATATQTPVPTATFTPSPMPTPTPLPVGRLPYVADFGDAGASLTGWDYDPNTWQVVNEGGENILIGQGKLDKPLVVLGLEQPEWLNVSDFVLNYNINLTPQSGGARMVFRCSGDACANGYEVLEVFPGLLSLKRNAAVPDIFHREDERVLKTANAPIEGNRWYSVTIWARGSRLYVYLNRKLVMKVEDLIAPQLSGGAVIMQTNSANRAVRFDNLSIQAAEPASEAFQSSGLPSTWLFTDTLNATMEQEGNGDGYLQLKNDLTAAPQTAPLGDMTLSCRVQVTEGGYQLRLRQSSAGSVLLDLVGGNLTLQEQDGNGITLSLQTISNFYNRNRWEDLSLTFIGAHLIIYRDGVIRYEGDLTNAPSAGQVQFHTRPRDVLRLDDCLFTQTAQSRNAGARFAIDLMQQVAGREFRELRSDLTEDFADIFRTDNWWYDGRAAAGQFLEDVNSRDHQRFLRLTHQNRETWRLFRNDIGVEIFGAGTDRNTFHDSTDLYISTEMHFPFGAGMGWMGVRTEPTLSGGALNGYFVALIRDANGGTTVRVWYRKAGEQVVYYDGAVPNISEQPLPEWVKVEVITYQDRLAVFVNGQFVVVAENTELLGGTLALGVETNSTVDFDTLIIRDTSPHDG